ncbi:hypothetical protein PsYK624_086840 [Phanerochaete sordida]|uniref:Uncharacterized protein n=1 Tax=Phanerochaete sordida TaxID=48140 RepID=A0A9P3LER3_9APHY|nr:hypothetical protein PsYK624_086840 [Phanerochaete sordida]
MPNFLDVPPTSFGMKDYQQSPHRRASGTSYSSWISSLAYPSATPGTPIPIPLDLCTPDSDSSAGTIKLSHAPPRMGEQDPETASSETEVTEATEKDEKETTETMDTEETSYGFKMSTLEEVPEHPLTPLTPPSALRGKARSIVGGLVSSIRSLPRAVTHSQVYDRRSAVTSATGTSSYVASGRTTMTMTPTTEHGALHPHKFAPPFPFPFVFAPPYPPPAHAHPHHALPHAHLREVHSPGGSAARSSKLGFGSLDMSELYGSGDAEPESGPRERLGGLVRELTSLPWVSTRVAVDYFPGESRTRSVPGKTSSSWYTMTVPSTPSDISQPGALVPEPWFPPRLSPALEVPDEEERAAAEDGPMGEAAEQRIEQLRDELRERTEELSQVRQIVEHQKTRIGELEFELQQLRREKEEVLQRRKSSVRKSMRASSFRASMRRTSVRVASTLID